MRSLPLLALPALLALTACGGGDTTTAEPVTYAADSVTVLESPEHGPQLCSTVAESLPPQCSGPDVVGWDWSKVRHESHGGTTWGQYRVVGTWDGAKLTLTEPPGPATSGRRRSRASAPRARLPRAAGGRSIPPRPRRPRWRRPSSG
ncbi:hypothetical protein WBK31_35795 [Nonomuraea sp. N2-4H]|uniref:hypothetical protein n=1 Tax=Nonomuraea sp. N2-4H TaxID=3128898 RepID=UPI0032523D3E